MNVFFEESGDFKVGTVLSQAGEAYQVEMPSGKRTKVKSRDVLLQFEKPDPATLLEQAKAIAADVDLEFLWEVAGDEEFGFAELGAEYFGHAPLPAEAAGLVLALHGSPIYFYKKGRGRYKGAPEQSLRAALAGIEKKKQQALVQASYVEELKAGRLPEALQPLVQQLLFKPDKNSIEYKALDTAASELQTTQPRLMLATKGIASAKDLHMGRFLFEHFPRGAGFQPVTVPSAPADLPLAKVAAFSIDDVTTTEIDDAFSVETLDDGTVRVGIHIAAPGLGIRPDDAIDKIARARMSTVYMPGDKITMLPDEVVEAFTLAEGKDCPALSLYAVLDPSTWTVISTTTRAERVPMKSNLRHNDLDELVNEETLASGEGEYPHKTELGLLWQWALQLEAGRMKKREAFGLKPEQANRVDFNFYVEDDVVTILRRKRGAPLDKIVAELMIFANSTWGKLLHDSGVPGIYRSQGPGAGGWNAKIQVRMVTHAAPHQGLGVDQYAWSTSSFSTTAAPLYRPGQPVADPGRCLPRRDRAAGGPVQAPRRDAVRDRIELRCRLRRLQRIPAEHGTLLVPALAGPGKRQTGRCRGAEGRGAAPGRHPAGDPPAGHAAGGARRPGAAGHRALGRGRFVAGSAPAGSGCRGAVGRTGARG
jgi:exoribonuclease-2